jgi:hypothetical protein
LDAHTSLQEEPPAPRYQPDNAAAVEIAVADVVSVIVVVVVVVVVTAIDEVAGVVFVRVVVVVAGSTSHPVALQQHSR